MLDQPSQFSQDCPGFSTESAMCWETPQLQANWKGQSPSQTISFGLGLVCEGIFKFFYDVLQQREEPLTAAIFYSKEQ